MIPAIAKRHPEPFIPEYAQVFLTALTDLNGERLNTQYGLNEIPWRAKHEYALSIGDSRYHSVSRFINILTKIDARYVAKENKKIMRAMEDGRRKNN